MVITKKMSYARVVQRTKIFRACCFTYTHGKLYDELLVRLPFDLFLLMINREIYVFVFIYLYII